MGLEAIVLGVLVRESGAREVNVGAAVAEALEFDITESAAQLVANAFLGKEVAQIIRSKVFEPYKRCYFLIKIRRSKSDHLACVVKSCK